MLTVKGLTDIGRGTLGTDSGAGNELKPTNKQANKIKIAHISVQVNKTASLCGHLEFSRCSVSS